MDNDREHEQTNNNQPTQQSFPTAVPLEVNQPTYSGRPVTLVSHSAEMLEKEDALSVRGSQQSQHHDSRSGRALAALPSLPSHAYVPGDGRVPLNVKTADNYSGQPRSAVDWIVPVDEKVTFYHF